MNRLTETKLEREIRIGFACIDQIFDDAIKKLDELKREYGPKYRVESVRPNDMAVFLQNAALRYWAHDFHPSYYANFAAYRNIYGSDSQALFANQFR